MSHRGRRSVSSCVIALPDNYRFSDAMQFHSRDPAGLAEIVGTEFIRKGILWNGIPALVEIQFVSRTAQCALSLDAGRDIDPVACHRLMARLLGLYIDIEPFEAALGFHPVVGPLIRVRAGLRIPMAASPYEALVWAITGQQVNLGVALQLRRRLIALGGQRHSSGIACHPDAAAVASLSPDQLGTARFSRAKTQALLTVSRRAVEGALPLDSWLAEPLIAHPVEDALLGIHGIGPWTASYTLLRGYGWTDAGLHGDVAVRNALQALLVRPDKISAREAETWLADFAPWRSLVAAHLWASLAK